VYLCVLYPTLRRSRITTREEELYEHCLGSGPRWFRGQFSWFRLAEFTIACGCDPCFVSDLSPPPRHGLLFMAFPVTMTSGSACDIPAWRHKSYRVLGPVSLFDERAALGPVAACRGADKERVARIGKRFVRSGASDVSRSNYSNLRPNRRHARDHLFPRG